LRLGLPAHREVEAEDQGEGEEPKANGVDHRHTPVVSS
jgi:hypothetical protein